MVDEDYEEVAQELAKERSQGIKQFVEDDDYSEDNPKKILEEVKEDDKEPEDPQTQIIIGKELKYYIDPRLKTQYIQVIKDELVKKDSDHVLIIDGPEGAGKSSLAFQIAKAYNSNFGLDDICMTPDEFTKRILDSPKGNVVVYDEAFTGLSSRQSLSEVNTQIVSLMMEMRQKNLFVIIVMPTFFMLDRYVALFRARVLIHVYTNKRVRGYFLFFNQRKKKLLYIYGKKTLNYGFPTTYFKGRFYGKMVVDEKKYRKKKDDALKAKDRRTKAAKFMRQRDKLIFLLKVEHGYSSTKQALLFEKYGIELKKSEIIEILSKIRKELEIKKAVELDIKQKEGFDEENEDKSDEIEHTGADWG